MRKISATPGDELNRESLYNDFNDEEPQERDLYSELKTRYSDNNDLDELEDDDDFNPTDYNDINSFDEEDEEENSYNKPQKNTDSLLNVLRNELKMKEFERGFLRFKYRGEIYDGVPMVEINPNKFVFKIDDKMKSILLDEIKVM